MNRCFYFFCALAFFSQTTFGQEKPFIFESYYLEDGLASEMVYCIAEDHNGLLWVGTANGLNRFDGSSFQKMYHSPDGFVEGASLKHQIVKALMIDKEGNIWVGTQGGGLNRIDHQTEEITYYLHHPDSQQSINHNEVLSLAQDSSGNIWVGTEDGLAIIEAKSGKIYKYYEDKSSPNGLYTKAILNILVSKKGKVLFSSWGGPVHEVIMPADGDLGKLSFSRKWHKDPLTNTPPDDATWGLMEDRFGRIWVSTFGQGLLIKDSLSTPNDWTFFGPRQSPKIAPRIFSISEDHNGNVWVGTSNGLTFLEFPEDANRPVSLNDAKIRTFFSRAGNASQISNNQIRDIIVASNDIVWIATEGGLTKFDPHISQFTAYLNSETPDLVDGISAICKDDKGNIWATNFLGELICIKENTGQKLKVDYTSKLVKEIPVDFVRCLGYINKKIWIGTQLGLFIYDPISSESRRIVLVSKLNGSQMDVGDLVLGPDGKIWVSSYQGIVVLDTLNWEYDYYQADPNNQGGIGLKDDKVNEILFTNDGQIWAAAEDSGLMQISFTPEGKMQSESYFPFPEDLQSLANRNLRSMAYDGEYIWVGGV
ncbi:MAG: two-component regulator propeller domain-containing protein, partial [Bacteroidota bacterium]